MKAKSIPTLAVLVSVTLIGSIAATTLLLQQEASAIIINYKDFKKMTHEFEKTVITAVSVGNPDEVSGDLDSFVIFMRSPMFPPDPALNALIANYEDGVTRIFSNPPPDDGKPHDQIKEFKQLTHAFEKAVIGAVNPPEPE
jgi:hypothetical protein